MAELYVVATPIGNLNDLSPRMAQALADCHLIAAEDTRVTMKLLNHLGLKKPLVSLNRHTEGQKAPGLVARMMEEDLTVCLTCDAGTPGISDPGVPLVAQAIEAGIRVTPICGPSAFTAHLSACGFDARTFGFYGFLPREKGDLAAKLEQIGRTGLNAAVFYESPHRVVGLVEAVGAAYPQCRLSVACDISKRYEVILTGPWPHVLEKLKANPNVEKGEYSLVVELPPPPTAPEQPALPLEAQMLTAMLEGQDLDQAAQAAAEQGHPRNQIYRAKLKIRRFLEASGGE